MGEKMAINEIQQENIKPKQYIKGKHYGSQNTYFCNCYNIADGIVRLLILGTLSLFSPLERGLKGVKISEMQNQSR